MASTAAARMLRASAGPLRSAGSAARPQIIARSQANALRQGAGSAQGIAGARNLFTRAQPQLFPRTRSFLGATVFVVGGTLFAIYYLDTRSAIHRWVVMPIMHATMDPETAHKAAVAILATGLAPRDRLPDDEVLATELWGKKLSNPIGLAAGFDKHAEAIDGIFDLGFGLIEVGSVTPEPQPGNPEPRYFRLSADQAAINRYGFNSEGHTTVLGRLRDRIRRWVLHESSAADMRIPISGSSPAAEELLSSHPTSSTALVDAAGLPRSLREGKLLAVNLGKNKTTAEESTEDYVKGVQRLGPYADAIVINVSSPNTPGLRRLQRRGVLEDLLGDVVKARDNMLLEEGTAEGVRVPLLVKIAPDLSETELQDVADAAESAKVDGIVVSNTTIQRPASLRSTEHVTETGGLSGPPVKPLALKALQTIYERTQGAIPLIGCGGISTGADALDFAKAGASAIELYTSFGYTGVGTPRRIKDELTELLRAEGKTWREVVGTGAPAGASRPKLPGPGDGGPRPEGLTPNSDDAFRRSVASVKSELENLRSTLSGGSEEAPAQTATPFHPPKDDVEYNDLLARVHAALASPREEGGARLPIPHADTTHTGTEGQKAKQQLEEALKDPVISPAALQEGAQTDATVATGQSPTSGRLV